MGLRCTIEDNRFAVEPSALTAARRITTGLWPGFPSDMVSLVTVLATQAEGETLMHDWMCELRLFALEQLERDARDLFLCDPHRIIVSGPTQLRGRLLDTRDIRSGMALIAAALAAEEEQGWSARDRRARLCGARRTPPVARRAGRADVGTRRTGYDGGDRLFAAASAARLLRRRDRHLRAGRLLKARHRRLQRLGNVGAAGCGSSPIPPTGVSRGGCWMPGRFNWSAPLPPPAPRPSRNGRRSASLTCSVLTMCGVSVRMMSVCVDSLRFLANIRPTSGRSISPGTPADRALFVANQPGEHVRLSVPQANRGRDLARREGRQP